MRQPLNPKKAKPLGQRPLRLIPPLPNAQYRNPFPLIKLNPFTKILHKL